MASKPLCRDKSYLCCTVYELHFFVLYLYCTCTGRQLLAQDRRRWGRWRSTQTELRRAKSSPGDDDDNEEEEDNDKDDEDDYGWGGRGGGD